jgi:hypothetical protein
MWWYWWAAVITSIVLLAVGTGMRVYAATALVRVVTPSAAWVRKESRLGTWGAILQAIGLLIAIVSFGFAAGYLGGL